MFRCYAWMASGSRDPVPCMILVSLPRFPVDAPAASPDSDLDVTILADSLTANQSDIPRLASSCNHISLGCNLDSTTNQLGLPTDNTLVFFLYSLSLSFSFLCRQCATSAFYLNLLGYLLMHWHIILSANQKFHSSVPCLRS